MKESEKKQAENQKAIEQQARKLVAQYKKGSGDYLKRHKVMNSSEILIIAGDKKSGYFKLLRYGNGATKTLLSSRGTTYDNFKKLCEEQF